MRESIFISAVVATTLLPIGGLSAVTALGDGDVRMRQERAAPPCFTIA